MAMLGQKCSTFHRIFLTVCRKEKKTYQYQVNLICNQIIILRTVPVLHYFYSVKTTFQKYIMIVCKCVPVHCGEMANIYVSVLCTVQ